MDINLNTKLSDMTLGELLEAISVGRDRRPATVTGLEGIASIFGVSISTAKRIKASGIIDKAISQHERVIVTDVDKALELYRRTTRCKH